MGFRWALGFALGVAAIGCGTSTDDQPAVPAHGWLRTWGGADHTHADVLAVSPDVIWVGGTFVDTADFDPTSGVFEMPGSGDINEPSGYLSIFSRDGAWLGAQPMFSPVAVALAPDGSGYLLGKEGNTLDTYGEVLLRRIGADGVEMWTRSWTHFLDVAFSGSLTLAPDGGVFMTFGFHGDLDLDPGPGEHLVESPTTEDDVALVAISADGSFKWGKRFGGFGRDRTGSLALAPGGGLVITGTTEDMSPGSSSTDRIWLERVGPDGNTIWSRVWGATAMASAYDVAIDTGSILLLEWFIASNGEAVDLDPGPAEYWVTPHSSAFYLASFDASGGFRWARALDAVGGISMKAGEVIITGRCHSGEDLDPGTGLVACDGGFFATRLSEQGEHIDSEQWSFTSFPDEDPLCPTVTQLAVPTSVLVTGIYSGVPSSENPFGPVDVTAPSVGAFLGMAPLR